MNLEGHFVPSALTPDSQLIQSPSTMSASSDRSSSFRFRVMNPHETISMNRSGTQTYEIPIVGYEVIEERARFTVFKLRIQNHTVGDYWFVFRRYTDFVRLFGKIRTFFPNVNLSLPRKRWFGDNFDPQFLNERISGLQQFVNSILQVKQLCTSKVVREFFCLDEPPSYAESVEESRAIFEALEETICHLRLQLRTQENEVTKLRLNLATETKKREELLKYVTTSSTKKCLECMKVCQKADMPSVPRSTRENVNMPQVMRVEDVTRILAELE